MFTGIIEETGTLAAFAAVPGGWKMAVVAGKTAVDAAVGDSIAVNGCCLTVARNEGAQLEFDLLAETRRLTGFAQLEAGARVNLESSLRFGGKMGGHFVTGHIDAVGAIDVFEPRGSDHYLRVRVPAPLARYVVAKGSIAIDGISLTVAEAGADTLAVWLIPHTLGVTSLADRKAGDLVNLEFDLLGKYVERLLPGRLG
jgi:riboflavin synthase